MLILIIASLVTEYTDTAEPYANNTGVKIGRWFKKYKKPSEKISGGFYVDNYTETRYDYSYQSYIKEGQI